MTDHELIATVMGILESGTRRLHGLHRNGRLLLALPDEPEAASMALNLYQPQRALARGVASLLRPMVRLRLHRMILPALRISSHPVTVTPPLTGIEAGTCGIMLGSPEHRVRRAIASYRISGASEVAKISFGDAGATNLEREARVLETLHDHAVGVPPVLGLHRAGDATVLRMPYLTGTPVDHGESGDAIGLLDRWITNQAPRRIDEFPEWPAIQSALSASDHGSRVLESLSLELLRPVIRHGDFARWNLLRRADGGLMVLDWEWGHEAGMPGLDLAHYFLQDARLVDRLSPVDAIRKTITQLESTPCREYLRRTGWSEPPLLPIIASLAFKQGAGHQDNAEVLEEILDFGC